MDDMRIKVLAEYGSVEAASDAMKEMGKQVTRLKNIAGAGEMNGGVINPKQMAEAQRIMDTVNSSTERYERSLKRVNSELVRLQQEHARLNREIRNGQADDTNFEKMERNAARQKELIQQKEEYTKSRNKAERLQDAAQDMSFRIDDMKSPEGKGGAGSSLAGGAMALMRRAGPWALAAGGAMSVLGFLSQSRSAYSQSLEGRLMLGGRGIDGDNDAATRLGIDPLRLMQLKTSMGMNGILGKDVHGASMTAAGFGRAFGMDPNQVGSIYGAMYQATGRSGYGGTVLLEMADAVRKGMDKTRSAELMNMVARNTQITAQAFGGANPAGSLGGAMGWAKIAMGMSDSTSYKQFAKSSEFYNVMQNGLKGAGTPMGEIMLFQSLGGFNGQMSYEKIHEMNLMKQGGFLKNPKMLSGLLGQLKGSKASQAGQLETIFKDWGLEGVPAEQLLDIVGSKSFAKFVKSNKSIKQMESGSKEEKELAKQINAFNDKLPLDAVTKAARDAEWHAAEMKAGEKLASLTSEISDLTLQAVKTLTRIADKIAPEVTRVDNSDRSSSSQAMVPTNDSTAAQPLSWNLFTTLSKKYQHKTTGARAATAYDKYFLEAEKETGVPFQLLKSVGISESDLNPNIEGRMTDSGERAAGIMQLMPKTARGLGVTDVFNPRRNIKGGAQYLKSLLVKYKGDLPKTLAAYNWGKGNVDSYLKTGHGLPSKAHPQGTGIPSETRDYIEKNMAIMEGMTAGGIEALIPYLAKIAQNTQSPPRAVK